MTYVNSQPQMGHVSPPGEPPALPTTAATAPDRDPLVVVLGGNWRSGPREIRPHPTHVRRDGGIFADQTNTGTRRHS
jgi:hypothetical protein